MRTGGSKGGTRGLELIGSTTGRTLAVTTAAATAGTKAGAAAEAAAGGEAGAWSPGSRRRTGGRSRCLPASGMQGRTESDPGSKRPVGGTESLTLPQAGFPPGAAGSGRKGKRGTGSVGAVVHCPQLPMTTAAGVVARAKAAVRATHPCQHRHLCTCSKGGRGPNVQVQASAQPQAVRGRPSVAALVSLLVAPLSKLGALALWRPPPLRAAAPCRLHRPSHSVHPSLQGSSLAQRTHGHPVRLLAMGTESCSACLHATCACLHHLASEACISGRARRVRQQAFEVGKQLNSQCTLFLPACRGLASVWRGSSPCNCPCSRACCEPRIRSPCALCSRSWCSLACAILQRAEPCTAWDGGASRSKAATPQPATAAAAAEAQAQLL